MPVRRATTATAIVCLGAIAGTWSVIRGLELSIAFWGERPENESLGGGLELIGLLLLLGPLVVAPRLAQATHKLVRGFVALPIALVAGPLLSWLFGDRAWADNVTLFAMIATAAAILVPPRDRRWLVGLAVGCLIAGLFGAAPMPGIGLAVTALTVSTIGDGTGEQRTV